MGLLLVVAAAIGWWAWRTRELRAIRFGDVAAVVAALIALRLMTTGKAPLGLLALAGAGWWYWFRRNAGAEASPAAPAPRPISMSPERARRLLDVLADADAAEIRAAHRRLVARLHPDAGGSDALAAEVNAARDALLAPGARRR